MNRVVEIEREILHGHLFCGIGGGAVGSSAGKVISRGAAPPSSIHTRAHVPRHICSCAITAAGPHLLRSGTQVGPKLKSVSAPQSPSPPPHRACWRAICAWSQLLGLQGLRGGAGRRSCESMKADWRLPPSAAARHRLPGTTSVARLPAAHPLHRTPHRLRFCLGTQRGGHTAHVSALRAWKSHHGYRPPARCVRGAPTRMTPRPRLSPRF